jgi:DNA (cytosine-5)-methyltransferase 1
MKVLSLFSGIGAFEKALDNLGVSYELAAYCEIDKYASKSYSAIHGVSESLNLGDITKMDEKALPHDLDLVTYGFPCQDISIAGKQKGLIDEEGKQTRSGLFFEALRIIQETQPRVAIAENVKNLTGAKFRSQFELVLKSLEEAGYNNYWKVLNLKDFGIPQNRERVFIVSIRKDIDNGTFTFPTGFPLEKRLKDMLEAEVDEKYYLSEKAINGLELHKERHVAKGNGFGYQLKFGEDISSTLSARYYKDGSECLIGTENCILAANLNHYQNDQMNRVYSPDGISPTILTKTGGGRETKILPDNRRIRRLTPKECFRLMGFDDSDHAKASAVNSNTQLYKQAGNSIGVPCVEYILMALIDCGILAI